MGHLGGNETAQFALETRISSAFVQDSNRELLEQMVERGIRAPGRRRRKAAETQGIVLGIKEERGPEERLIRRSRPRTRPSKIHHGRREAGAQLSPNEHDEGGQCIVRSGGMRLGLGEAVDQDLGALALREVEEDSFSQQRRIGANLVHRLSEAGGGASEMEQKRERLRVQSLGNAYPERIVIDSQRGCFPERRNPVVGNLLTLRTSARVAQARRSQERLGVQTELFHAGDDDRKSVGRK